ncbi:hypothetical protein FACS1894163_01110 [Spirochaetia bacterium]|nr:hypothetical protein FACS1894163_01110 [Spirochaetia bacterium]
MKKRGFIFGLLAMMLALCLVFTACPPGGGNTTPESGGTEPGLYIGTATSPRLIPVP